MRGVAIALVALPLLVGCETVSSKSHFVTDKSLHDGKLRTVDAAFSAALTPLEDIGLRKRKIPEQLKQLVENPYHRPASIQCDTVRTELADITYLLGEDVDAPKVALSAQDEYIETGTNLLHDAVVSLVRNQTDIIPFRSLIRRVTGANAHEKLVGQAVHAGQLRRAYLRGLADARFGNDCPTGPQIISAELEKIIAREREEAEKMAATPSQGLEIAHK